jgi:hypothetical protein
MAMPLFKVSAGSEVPVSAVVTSNARTMEDTIAEVRGLQARARVNWSRAGKPIGAIEAPYEIWAVQRPDGSWEVSLTAVIPITAQQTVIAEDDEAVQEAVLERQTSGLIQWLYRGIPIGEYRAEIPTYWANQQPELQTASTVSLSATSRFPGQSVLIAAEVTASETPVGNVEFVDDTPGGFGLIALTALEKDPLTVGISRASAVVVMPEGAYSVRARYLGSDGFQPTQSVASSLSVTKVATNVSVTPPSPPLYAGQSFSLGVQVSHAVSGAPAPTGIITLFQGSSVLGSKQVIPAADDASESFALGTLSPGTYSFVVQYDGDNVHEGNSVTVTDITVQQATTTVALTVLSPSSEATLSTSVFSQPIRLRAIVTSVIAGTRPTGTVTFKRGGTTITTGTLVPDTGTSSQSRVEVIVSDLSVTTHSLTAEYGGNASFAASTSGAVSHTVGKASVSISATSINSPTRSGATAQFTASVAAVSPATVSPFQQYGTGGSVTYKDVTSTVVNFNSQGQATRSLSTLPVGANEVGVSFAATAEFNAASTSFIHAVNKADVSIAMTFSPNPSSWSVVTTAYVTITAVAPGVGVPTGTVSFTLHDPYYYGNLFIGTATLSGGQTSLSQQAFILVTDTYGITAQYSGDSKFNAASKTEYLQIFGYYF